MVRWGDGRWYRLMKSCDVVFVKSVFVSIPCDVTVLLLLWFEQAITREYGRQKDFLKQKITEAKRALSEQAEETSTVLRKFTEVRRCSVP